MTPEDVEKRVTQIKEMAADDEAAHSEEDQLYRDVLFAIARGECEDPGDCAITALRTIEIKFQRWCA